MSFLGKVGRGLKKSVRAVYRPIRQLDPTSSRSAVGSKLPKGVRKTIKTVATYGAAPLVVPTALVVKGTTALGAKTGARPLVQLDRAAGRVYRSAPMKELRSNYRDQLVTGASAGAAISGAKGLASLADMGKGLSANLTAPELTSPEPGTVADPPETVAPSSGDAGQLVAAAGASALGALALGPLGALAGIPVYFAAKGKR